MLAIKDQLVEIIDYLPNNELNLLFEIARRFMPDDVATPDDLADIKQANEEFERGEFVRESEINWK